VTYTKAWSDGQGMFILETAERGDLRYGVLVNTKSGDVGEEQPVDSIARWLPYSDFQPFTGELPVEVKNLLEHAKK
jgi:hypothetical protein